MRPVRILIVDDEALARDVVRVYLGEYPQVTIVGEAADGREGLVAVAELEPDIVFLDIQMPGMDGLQVAAALRAARSAVLVAFVTAYDRHAVSAFELNALDYLLKPFDKERFGSTMDRLLERLEKRDAAEFQAKLGSFIEDYGRLKTRSCATGAPHLRSGSPVERLVAKENGRIVIIHCCDIDWIEAAGDYVKVHAGGKEHLVNDTMRALDAKMAPDVFMRVHRSSLVNIHKIESLEPHTNGEYYIRLVDGTKLKSSRTYSDNVRRLLSGEAKDHGA